MRIVCSRADGWLSNSWLLIDRHGARRRAVLIDSGGPVAPIRDALAADDATLVHVLCTHHHPDHVAHNDVYRSEFGATVLGHAAERDLFERGRGGPLDDTVDDGDEIEVGALRLRALHIPGHTCGQLGFVLERPPSNGDSPAGPIAFTGDTLFRRSVGGNRGPGHTTFDDLRHSILDVLLALPPQTTLYPGHMDTTTVAEEREHNRFVRLWRGELEPQAEPRTWRGRPVTLELEAPDYDGGTKCQIVDDDGERAVVGGSSVRPRD